MNYTFWTELFGLSVMVDGVFVQAEPELGLNACFEINTIEHQGYKLIDLPNEDYEAIEQAAFDHATINYGE
jgi:hypothetical protein